MAGTSRMNNDELIPFGAVPSAQRIALVGV
jgi:hypothetical protein